MTTAQMFQWLSKKLYPDGRAFRMQEDGYLYRLHRALNLTFARTKTDAEQILYDILPDNANFDIDTARKWYRRLGLYDSGSVTLADMKKAIAQKLSFPLTPLNKRHPAFIQAQLQAAGFNVYVYRNKFSDGMGGWITKTPQDILGISTGYATLGGFSLGEANLGSTWADDGISIVHNYIEESLDEGAVDGSNYNCTFFIAGATVDSFADVSAARKIEFRQLLLKLKAQHMVGIMFINYV